MAFLVNPYVHGAGAVSSYLLDTYSATVAYSLRQLKTGVTSVVRVRRSPGNQEQDFTATEVADGTLASFIGSGKDGYVTTWYDQSGNGNNITQSTASSQPRLVASGVVQPLTDSGTSRNAITFGVASSQLDLGSALTALNNGNDFSIFTVADGTNGTVHATLSTRTNTASNSAFYDLTGHAASGALTQVHNGTSGTNVIIGSNLASSTYIYTTIVDGTAQSVDCYYDGNGAYTNTWTGSYANLDLRIGRANARWDAKQISELIIFDSDQSANRTDIESDINTYYSIY